MQQASAAAYVAKGAANCRQMLILAQNPLGPIQEVDLRQAPGNIQSMLWRAQSGKAPRLVVTYKNKRIQQIRLLLKPEHIRGVSFSCIRGQACPQVPGLENQEFVRRAAGKFSKPTFVSCRSFAQGGNPGAVLFNNFANKVKGTKAPPSPVIKLTGRCAIKEVLTFHHNNFRGKPAGKLTIKGVRGTGGSWTYRAINGAADLGSYSMGNIFWIVRPANLVLGPGSYQIALSDPAGWSHSDHTGNQGFVTVWGTCSRATPATATPQGSLGDWKWFTGSLKRLGAGGQIYQYDNGKKQWVASQGTRWYWKDVSRRILIINWDNNRYIDTLTLSKDGSRLDGRNQNGVRVTATRIAAPAQTGNYKGKARVLKSAVYTWKGSKKNYARISSNYVVKVGMGGNRWGYGYAGVLLAGAKGLNVKILSAPKTYERHDKNSFAGFVVDYGVGDGIGKRVYLGIGMVDTNRWGGFDDNPASPQARQFVNLGRHGAYSLNLANWAPQGWNGKTWFYVGVANIGANKYLKAQITSLR